MVPRYRCPRCGGNQFRVKDQFGDYLSCLQCGRTTDLETSAAFPVGLAAGRDGIAPSERRQADGQVAERRGAPPRV